MDEHRPLSRRDLFRGKLFGRLADAAARRVEETQAAIERAMPPAAAPPPAPARTYSIPVHRPPGAVDEASFLKGCTRCGECIVACPVHAIVIAPPTYFDATGTPMIDAHTRACVMCEDTPCITACEPRVLRKERPLKMGTASIEPLHCLAFAGSLCTVCSVNCPVTGAIAVEDGKPRIVEPNCTGCGVCHAVCPAPANAVTVTPLDDRPE